MSTNIVELDNHRYDFEKLFTSRLNWNTYNNNFANIEKCGGKILAAGLVNLNAIEIRKGSHQTRAEDYDKSHVARLAQQIDAARLTNIPFVEWCPDVNKFCVLSGHHRIYAMKEMKWDQMPVCVLSFKDAKPKAIWLQRENQHEAAKEHTVKDAIKFIDELKSEGHLNWDTRSVSEEDQIKKEVYDILNEAGYTFGGKYKKDIFAKAFSHFTRSTIAQVDAQESDKAAQAMFNQELNCWKNDTYIISSNDNASRKSLFHAFQKRSEEIYEKGLNPWQLPVYNIKVLTYFPSSYKEKRAFEKQRKDFLHSLKSLNLVGFKSVNVIVEHVVFHPQFRGKRGNNEKDYVHYIWDDKKKDFVKQIGE